MGAALLLYCGPVWRSIPLLAVAACSGAATPDAGSLKVVASDDSSADWSCVAPESCKADYLGFSTIAVDHAAPISEAALEQQLLNLDAGAVPLMASLTATELTDRTLDGLAVRFLRDGVDGRELDVITTARSDTATYHEEDLLFRDPFVGTFKAILLTPKTTGPFPAILALHGHGGDAANYRDQFGGTGYPEHGYAVLMITSRAMGIDADEHEVSHALMRSGFTLMGLRTYEALLGLKYLRWRRDVVHDRIGLIGHSGGSSTGNLLVRFEPGFRAYVSDHQVDWWNSGVGEPWHCETVPALFPVNALINDFTTSATPVRKVVYGYPEGFVGIFAFFDHYLKAR